MLIYNINADIENAITWYHESSIIEIIIIIWDAAFIQSKKLAENWDETTGEEVDADFEFQENDATFFPLKTL